jgi:hypothetical protein
MTTYQTNVENYGPNGLIDSEVIQFDLTGEDEQRHLSPDRLRNAYATLRAWQADAEAAYADWPNKSAAQKDATTRVTIQRLGILCDRLADLLLLEGRT